MKHERRIHVLLFIGDKRGISFEPTLYNISKNSERHFDRRQSQANFADIKSLETRIVAHQTEKQETS